MKSEVVKRNVFNFCSGIWILFLFVIESSQGASPELRIANISPGEGKHYVLSGDTVVLSCTITSSQTPIRFLRWIFNDRTLESDQNMLTIASTNTTTGHLTNMTSELRWVGVTEEQSGVYTCADSDRNRQTLNITVISLTASHGYLNLERESLENIPIGCSVSNLAPSKYMPVEWVFKDQVLDIYNDLHHSKYIAIDINNTLIIKNADEADTGNYTCVLKLLDRNETFRQTVGLFVLPSIEPFDIGESRVTEGDGMTLRCRIRGDHIQTVKWFKDNSSLTNGEHVELQPFRSHENASLFVQTLGMKDAGNYSCYVENNIGASSVLSVDVVVLDRYAALWPFLGIVAEVFILSVIANIYDRYLIIRSKKKESSREEEEEEKEECGVEIEEEAAVREPLANTEKDDYLKLRNAKA